MQTKRSEPLRFSLFLHRLLVRSKTLGMSTKNRQQGQPRPQDEPCESPIGFVVDHRKNCTVLASILSFVLPERSAVVASTGGSATIHRSHEAVQELLDDGCQHVLVVFDRWNSNRESMRDSLYDSLRSAGIKRSLVSFFSPKPSIDSWLVAKEDRNGKTARRAVELLLQGGQTIESIAEKADFDSIAKNQLELRRLLAKLRGIGKAAL